MPTKKPIIGSKVDFFAELFRTGCFRVPWHQRAYDWKKGDVSVLLHDLKEAFDKKEKCYFLGSLMLVEDEETDERTCLINDGQQRMATFSLLCASLCHKFNERGEVACEERALQILFDIDMRGKPHTLADANNLPPRLTLSGNDNNNYAFMIRGQYKGKNGKLTDAKNEIDRFVSAMDIQQAVNFFNYLLESVEVSCLRIPAAIDPTAIFETINHRGKPLEDFDLIRNYIYSFFNSERDDAMRQTVHNNLEGISPLLKQKTIAYIRCFFHREYGYLPKDTFYKAVRNCVAKNLGGGGAKTPKNQRLICVI